ncbi:MAG: hypothetical protein F6J97_21090 [Leptolyngbya sp. SIO4C1]|nr:hypothetical protein [Leptolyngbya sp. SIO4C1]
MSFDMYVGDRHESIAPHEENIFFLIIEQPTFPELSRLWEVFYRSPTLSSQQAHDIVHELIELSDHIADSEENRYLLPVIYRLLRFFNQAYCTGQSIRCVSD